MNAEAQLGRQIIQAGVRGRDRRGTALMREGEPADRVLTLLTGFAVASRRVGASRPVAVALRGPGTVLGEIGAVSGAPRIATVTAVTPVTYAVVPASSFARRVAADAVLASSLVEHLGDRLRATDRRRARSAGASTMARLTGMLWDLEVTEVPLTQRDVADLIDASLEATAKALRILRADGALATQRGRIVIRDRARLARHDMPV